MTFRPITDMWVLARPKVKYYGAYPGGFLERARNLLGVSINDAVLHVCSGMVRDYPYRGFGDSDRTLDLDPELMPDYCQDARAPFPTQDNIPFILWDAVLADPPYTEADAEHYEPGAKLMPSPGKILKNALEVVRIGGKVGILHYKSPPPPKGKAKLVAWVGVVMGHNNNIRLFSVYERLV